MPTRNVAIPPRPVFHVTAITHRKDAVYPATLVGIPPMEDFYIGGASVKLFLPIFKTNLPERVDLALPAEGVFHNLVFVSIKKTYPQRDSIVAVRKDSPKVRPTCSTTPPAKSPAAASSALTLRRNSQAKASNAHGRR